MATLPDVKAEPLNGKVKHQDVMGRPAAENAAENGITKAKTMRPWTSISLKGDK